MGHNRSDLVIEKYKDGYAIWDLVSGKMHMASTYETAFIENEEKLKARTRFLLDALLRAAGIDIKKKRGMKCKKTR